MPELPEIETIAKYLKYHLKNNKIKYTIIRNNKLRWYISKEIIQIQNKIILNIKRKGKYLLIHIKNGWIIIHLGMSGNISIVNYNTIPKKHDHIDLLLEDGKILRYNDPRKFGSWFWAKKIKNNHSLTNLGIEPLSLKFNKKYLFNKIKNKKVNIKIWLMNNKNIAGIGNIYANEILFHAKILPTRLVNSLTMNEIEYLVIIIKKILKIAIKYGGTTIKNFFQPNGVIGLFKNKLCVYNKHNKPCIYCNKLIKKIKLRERSTYFCFYCQK